MTALDSVLGAGLLLDGEYTVTDGNDRCEVVFRDELSRIDGKTLAALREDGLIDSHTQTTWERAIDTILAGRARTRTEQIELSPFGTAESYPYELKITPVATEAYPDQVCCSLRSVGPTQQYGETITALEAGTEAFMTAEDVEEVLEQTAVAANDVLAFPGIGVRRYDPETEQLDFLTFGARVEDLAGRPPYPVGDSPQGDAFRRGETLIEDIGESDEFDREVFTQTMYLPIGDAGLLSVGTVGETFSETDVQFAEILTENAAAAIRLVESRNSLREERERLDLLKTIFARVLRHNLRNEMSVISANAELLAERVEEADSRFIDNILSSVDAVTELSEKADDFAEIADETQTPERTDLVSTIYQSLSRVHEAYPGTEFSVEYDEAPVVQAHPSLGTAVRNLLENACEHGSGPITVEVSSTDERARLSISDTGPGIPQSEIDVLERKDETALEHTSGLGLWIVNWVVEHSNGTIEFQTTDGTCVEIELSRVSPDSE